MNSEEFQVIFDYIVSECRDTLIVKAKEYADDSDRLHNFNIAQHFIGGTPEEALWGFLTKHLVSIRDMVNSRQKYPSRVWDEKIGDSINYLILLRALVADSDEAAI